MPLNLTSTISKMRPACRWVGAQFTQPRERSGGLCARWRTVAKAHVRKRERKFAPGGIREKLVPAVPGCGCLILLSSSAVTGRLILRPCQVLPVRTVHRVSSIPTTRTSAGT